MVKRPEFRNFAITYYISMRIAAKVIPATTLNNLTFLGRENSNISHDAIMLDLHSKRCQNSFRSNCMD